MSTRDAVTAKVRVLVRRLDPDLPLPSYARAGDAGADLVSREDAVLPAAGGRALVGTGIAIAIPDGQAGFVQPRSGLADPDVAYEVRRGDRIAQLVIQPVEAARFTAVDELPPSERGVGGFGHSGT